jgi:hypothetical protein
MPPLNHGVMTFSLIVSALRIEYLPGNVLDDRPLLVETCRFAQSFQVYFGMAAA